MKSKHALVAGDDETGNTQGCGPRAHDEAVLVAVSPVSDLLLERHGFPSKLFFVFFAIDNAETLALPEKWSK